ncbi:hypothetical protein C8R45DRAFT_990049 [Mycena sanguinolenta]|nr:hypothetical protein C8R45DRAFT_990049 [Mycena sanguinolenta]
MVPDDPVFPPEVFEIIIGKLAGDLDSLRSCALVSWTFYSLTSLFSRLQVGPRFDQEQSPAKLCDLLEESPSFAARVQSLRLCDKWADDRPSWITEADLSRCFSPLRSLTRLCLEVKGSYWPWRHAWPQISAANRDAIQSILPNLTCLELHSVSDFPFTLLAHCSLLRSLTLDAVTFAENSGHVVTTVKGSRIHLKHLYLHVPAFLIGGFLDWIMSPDSPLDISCLSSLECTVHDLMGHLSIQRLLEASAPSLHHLRIVNYSFFAYNRDYNLELRMFRHLETLTLDIWLDIIDSRDYQSLLSLSHVVLPLQQKLALVFNQVEDPRPKAMQRIISADSALAALPNIASVTIILWHCIPPRMSKETFVDVSDEFVQQMPLLASRAADTGGLHVLKSTRPGP